MDVVQASAFVASPGLTQTTTLMAGELETLSVLSNARQLPHSFRVSLLDYSNGYSGEILAVVYFHNICRGSASNKTKQSNFGNLAITVVACPF